MTQERTNGEIAHYEVTGNPAYKPMTHEMTCTTYEKRPLPPDMRVQSDPDKEFEKDCNWKIDVTEFLMSDKVTIFSFTVVSHEAMLEAIELFKDIGFSVEAEPKLGYYEVFVKND